MKTLIVRLIITAVLVLSTGFSGLADIISEHTSPIHSYYTPEIQALGQSVTTSAGGPWDSIEFNFYLVVLSTSAISLGPATAYGTLYLLSQTYAGLPGDLSESTPGFIARTSMISSGVWQFDSSATLLGSSQYFFFTNMAIPLGTLVAASGLYDGGTAMRTSLASPYYYGPDPDNTDVAFSLRGSPASVPEPSTLLTFATGLLLLLVSRRRRL